MMYKINPGVKTGIVQRIRPLPVLSRNMSMRQMKWRNSRFVQHKGRWQPFLVVPKVTTPSARLRQ